MGSSSKKEHNSAEESYNTGSELALMGDVNGDSRMSSINLANMSFDTSNPSGEAGGASGAITLNLTDAGATAAAIDMAEEVSRTALQGAGVLAGDAMRFNAQAVEDISKSITSIATDDSAETLQTAIKYGAVIVAAAVVLYIWSQKK